MHQYGSINTECSISKYYIEDKPDKVADILFDTTGLANKVNCFDDAYVQPIWEESWARHVISNKIATQLLTLDSAVEVWCDELANFSRHNITRIYDYKKYGPVKGFKELPDDTQTTFEFRWEEINGACTKELWSGFYKDQCVDFYMAFRRNKICKCRGLILE
jgi:hypothetical protein